MNTDLAATNLIINNLNDRLSILEFKDWAAKNGKKFEYFSSTRRDDCDLTITVKTLNVTGTRLIKTELKVPLYVVPKENGKYLELWYVNIEGGNKLYDVYTASYNDLDKVDIDAYKRMRELESKDKEVA